MRPRLVVRHLGWKISVTSLLPFLWAVDIEWEANPDAGEGPAAFWSWGSLKRARRRGLIWVDENAEIEVPVDGPLDDDETV